MNQPEIRPRYYIDSTSYKIHSLEQADGSKIALLTFDDGPAGASTVRILDALDRHGVKSIWFISGFQYGDVHQPAEGFADSFVKLVKEIRARGHLIANHAWQHVPMSSLSLTRQREEIFALNDLLFRITGEKPSFFRPPYARGSDDQKWLVREAGMQYVNLSLNARDYELMEPELIRQEVLAKMHGGANICMHDLNVTARALDAILRELLAQGYRFVLPTEVYLA